MTNQPDDQYNVLDSLNRYPLQPDDMPRQLVEANDDQQFWLHDGPGLHNLRELKQALDMITEEQFMFHVGENKNDFAMWVDTVLKDHECSEEMWKCKTVLSTRRVLIKYLKNYI